MISSEYLWGGLDKETAKVQKELFERKRAKGYALLGNLKEHFDLLDFSEKQDRLQHRVNKIKKAIEFANEQVEEAKEVLASDKPCCDNCAKSYIAGGNMACNLSNIVVDPTHWCMEHERKDTK